MATIINATSIGDWGTLPESVLPGQMLFHAGKGAIKMSLGNYTTSTQISNDDNWATLSQLSGWDDNTIGTFFNNSGKLALTDAISYKTGTNTIDNIVLNVPLYNSANTNLEFGTSKDFRQMHLGYWSPGGSTNYRNISIIRGGNTHGGGTQSVLIQTFNGSSDAYVPHGMKFQGDTVYPIASISLGSPDERFSNIYATNLDLSNTLTANGEISLAKHTNANNYRIKANSTNGIILQTFKNIDSSYKSYGLQFYGDTIYPYYNGYRDTNANQKVNLGSSNNRFNTIYANSINVNTLTVNTAINLPDGSISTEKLTGVIGRTQIDSNAVTTSKIADSNVTGAKIGFATTGDDEITDTTQFISSGSNSTFATNSNLYTRSVTKIWNYINDKITSAGLGNKNISNQRNISFNSDGSLGLYAVGLTGKSRTGFSINNSTIVPIGTDTNLGSSSNYFKQTFTRIIQIPYSTADNTPSSNSNYLTFYARKTDAFIGVFDGEGTLVMFKDNTGWHIYE